LSFSLNVSLGPSDVFLTQLNVPQPGHSWEYGPQAGVQDWASGYYGYGTYSFSPPWEVTGSPSLTISYSSSGQDVIDNPCSGGSSGSVSWDNIEGYYQGYVLNPTWLPVPTYNDTTNLVDGLLAPVAASSAQAETDAQSGITAAGNAQATANLALVQMQQPDGLAFLSLTNGRLQQINWIGTNCVQQVVVTAMSPSAPILSVGQVLNGSGLGDNGAWVSSFNFPFCFIEDTEAYNYTGQMVMYLARGQPPQISDNASSGSWTNCFPFTYTNAANGWWVTVDYVKSYHPVTNAVPTIANVSNMIAAAIAAYTNHLGH